VPLEPPGPQDVTRLARRIVRRLSKIASRYLAGREDLCRDPDEQATLSHALSLAQRPPVRPQGALRLSGLELPTPPRPERCANLGGFSLHAARTVEPTDRLGLERLCRYGLRAPFSARRLSVRPDGRVRYELPKPWPHPNGVTELILEPVWFLKRLAALLPAPYQNLVRYHGVFANRSRYRSRLPLPPEATDTKAPGHRHVTAHPCLGETRLGDISAEPQTALPLEDPAPLDPLDSPDHFQPDLPSVRPRRLSWARLLKRSLGVDGLECPGCGAQMVLLALITAPATVARILDHLHIPSTPPPVAPARRQSQPPLLPADELDQTDPFEDGHSWATANLTRGAATPRAPPRGPSRAPR